MSRVQHLLFLVVIAFLASCGGGGSSLPSDTLVIGIIGDMDTINDYVSHSAFTAEITKHLFLQLLEEQPDFGEHPPTFKPMLAESWEVTDEGTTYTFKLREGVKWSDGTPVTSADVLFTHKAATSSDLGWGGQVAKELIESVEAPDPHTVIFHLKKAYPYALMDINEGKIVPAHSWGKVPTAEWSDHDFSTGLVVSGPYTLTEWRRQESILITANPSYYKSGYPKIKNILFQIIPDQNSLLQQLLAGSIDYMVVIPPKDAGKVRENPQLEMVSIPDIQYGYIGWNQENPLFTSKKVRQALTMGINRQTIIDTVWYGFARVCDSPIISNFWAHNSSISPIGFDPEGAKALLKAEGWEDHDGDGIIDRDGKPFLFTLQTNSGNKVRNDIAVLVQNDLSALGIKMDIQLLDFNVFIQNLMGHNFDACVQGWRVSTKLDLREIWHSDYIENGLNVISYKNSEVDRLLTEVIELPLDRQKPVWDEIQALIYEDQPYTFLYENERVNGINRRVANYEMNPLSSYFHLEAWSITP